MRSLLLIYREALHELEQSLTITPGRANLVNACALFAAWSKHPNQAADSTRPNQFHGTAIRDGVILPVSIHGKTAHWALDTGANFSIMSEAEAAMFGVAVDESSARVSDQAGGATKISTAVVDELSIGDVRFRNVAFLVTPDSQEPMKDLSPERTGLDWDSDSRCLTLYFLEIRRNVSDRGQNRTRQGP